MAGALLATHAMGSADGWWAVLLCVAAVSLGAAAVFATLSSATLLDQPETPARARALPTEAARDQAYPVGPPAAEAASEMRRRKIVAADPGGKGAPALAASSDSVISA